MAAGCAFQSPNDVLIREPGVRTYSPAQPVQAQARRLVDYAVLSANVYFTDWGTEASKVKHPGQGPTGSASDPAVMECENGDKPIDLKDWKRWDDFPSSALRAEADTFGLYFEVWQNKSLNPPIVAMIFRGTQFDSWLDWQANLRWLVKWIPGWKDQYWVVRNQVRDKFRKALLENRSKEGPAWRPVVVTTGHSLGGGLAQQLAYSLLDDGEPSEVRGVSEVFAFDPSPVTGWYSVPEGQRIRNAKGLSITRAFEHGEVLAYLRLLFSYAYPPSAQDPAIWEVRFNFNESWNPFSSHGMRALACHLQGAAGTLATNRANALKR